MKHLVFAGACLAAIFTNPAFAEDAEGCEDHPAVTRYPGSDLEWCQIENFLPYKFPLGPVTGYRHIGEIEDIEGRVTRNFYSYKGDDRTHSEIWKNYSDAIKAAGFEIVAEGLFPERNVKPDVGGGSWQGVHLKNNAWNKHGPVAKMVSGTSSSGGTGAVLAKKERADDTLWVAIAVEQHSATEVGVLVDLIETKPAETGLITADAEAMGKDIEELGRTVINGLMFEHDKADLMPESAPALAEAAKVLEAMPDKSFYVVGHTDSSGTYAYNFKLSSDRALSVVNALVADYGVETDRLQPVGVGPVSPVFTNASDGGKEKNRRVELVEK
ncbi:MAG: hypothetical protein CME88_04640 [Hirschia sp.]|nr:hypothetical protein [Hirschia sp.]MBB37315.1 hypothetical protein [Hirschia sp.]MBF17649.1 hypothetical protein [Hirschia sp.]|tara:strand:- start:1233 stop:2216 length:984 start_codon:yes stop_codon:yes gene_type:complete